MRDGTTWRGFLYASAPMATGAAGSWVTARGMGWYRMQAKPAFTPPDRAFGPVWTVLYGLMAASAWRIARKPRSARRVRALRLWWLQLGLNAVWTPLFFGARRKRLALVDLGLLLPVIGSYMWAAGRVDRPAAWMMAPYLGWSLFAAALNEEIVRLNRG